jgi:hypothetical protein
LTGIQEYPATEVGPEVDTSSSAELGALDWLMSEIEVEALLIEVVSCREVEVNDEFLRSGSRSLPKAAVLPSPKLLLLLTSFLLLSLIVLPTPIFSIYTFLLQCRPLLPSISRNREILS